jgi:hypothetical protein
MHNHTTFLPKEVTLYLVHSILYNHIDSDFKGYEIVHSAIIECEKEREREVL